MLINSFAAGGSVRIFVTRCTIEGLTSSAIDTEVGGGGSGLITVSGSTITNNNYGWYIGGSGVIKTLGNNHIQDNTTTFGIPTSALLQ